MKEYQVIIIGGGVSGTAAAYVLNEYSTVSDVAVIEKEDAFGRINSKHTNNSQTLHFGDIETNYTYEKAKQVRANAELLAAYLERADPSRKMHAKRSKMVLGVGREETEKLRARFEEFQSLFPRLSVLDKPGIEDIEPAVVRGRDEDSSLLALQSPDGFVVDYGEVAKHLGEEADNAGTDTYLGEEVLSIHKDAEGFKVKTQTQVLHGQTILVAAGSHTLSIAQDLGHGKHLTLLPVAGSFFTTREYLNGKVYTLQMKKLPFAAVHGDADVHDPTCTRFGPTAKVVFTLERRNYSTVPDFFNVFRFSLDAFRSYFNILADKILFPYVTKNMLYDIPFLGKYFFLPNIKKVVPEIKASEVKRARGYGGVRPQIVNTKTRKLEMGEARLLGKNSIFNITPSPGASTCLGNARRDAAQIASWLGETFDDEAFLTDHIRTETNTLLSDKIRSNVFSTLTTNT